MRYLTLAILSLFSVLATAPEASANANRIIEFRIKAGTGKKPWNTPETVVEAKVGDTVRIFNDDSMVHLLHTPGVPCEHGKVDMKKGDHYDCVITDVADPDVDKCYDHNIGESSRFYIRATN